MENNLTQKRITDTDIICPLLTQGSVYELVYGTLYHSACKNDEVIYNLVVTLCLNQKVKPLQRIFSKKCLVVLDEIFNKIDVLNKQYDDVRVVIPLYNEGTGEIEYWKKTGTWVQNTLQPLAQQLQQGQPISGQVFIIGRTGEGLQTRYSVMPDMSRPNDGRKADEFGEIQDAYTTGMIKEADYDYDPNAVPQQNNFGQPQQGFNQQPQQGFNQQFNQGYNQQSFGGQQATRRVVDSF